MQHDVKSRSHYPVWTTDNIRYCDLDPNEHVNNGAINAFFEDGRVRFRQQHLSELAGGTLTGFVLARASVEYLAPIYFPGDVDVGTVIARVGRTSYTLHQGLFDDSGCAATAEIITVLVDTDTGRPVPIPDDWRALFRRFGHEVGD